MRVDPRRSWPRPPRRRGRVRRRAARRRAPAQPLHDPRQARHPVRVHHRRRPGGQGPDLLQARGREVLQLRGHGLRGPQLLRHAARAPERQGPVHRLLRAGGGRRVRQQPHQHVPARASSPRGSASSRRSRRTPRRPPPSRSTRPTRSRARSSPRGSRAHGRLLCPRSRAASSRLGRGRSRPWPCSRGRRSPPRCGWTSRGTSRPPARRLEVRVDVANRGDADAGDVGVQGELLGQAGRGARGRRDPAGRDGRASPLRFPVEVTRARRPRRWPCAWTTSRAPARPPPASARTSCSAWGPTRLPRSACPRRT